MAEQETVVDTIAAISTPPGRGGIGIVRLSGPQAAPIAGQLVRLRQPLEHARARLADVLDGCFAPELTGGESEETDAPFAEPPAAQARIDEAVVTFYAAPNSYTAQDLVEIAAHGSPVVLRLLLENALSLGARLADPGEFTQRAFLAGKLDLTQAEAVRDLIDAQTLTQARQAASQMGGALSRRVAPIKHDLVELIALLEAGIDFAEDDVEVTAAAEISRRIDALAAPLQGLEASFARGRLVHDGFTLAIVGRPNAGKSSLFNRLVERERAIVTASPGTTRDLVTERIALEGIPLELVDTAGLRETVEEVEQLGIARTREALADAAIVLIVLDATQSLNDEERRLLAAVEGRPALIALNKSDLNSEMARAGREKASFAQAGLVDEAASSSPQSDSALGSAPAEAPEESRDALEANTSGVLPEGGRGVPLLRTSALTGEGIAALRDQIVTLATHGAEPEAGMLTSLRHHQAVTTALSALSDGARANASAIPHEMILIDLYRALWALDSLTGQTTPDDILNLIFSTFCIGK